jgi:hypothetical protein
MGAERKNYGAVGIVDHIKEEENEQGNTHLVWTDQEKACKHDKGRQFHEYNY